MTDTKMLTGWLLSGATALTALTGCAGDDRRHREDDTYDITRVAVLSVTVGAGDVVVTASDRDSVRIVRTLHWQGAQDGRPRAEHTVSGDRLDLSGVCTVKRDGCAVDYRLEVPRDLRVTLRAETGDLTVHGLAGDLAAVTGAGDVTVRLAGGPYRVDAQTSAGDRIVEVPNDTAATLSVTARTGAGDVRVLPVSR
jgi:hypothetical protein